MKTSTNVTKASAVGTGLAVRETWAAISAEYRRLREVGLSKSEASKLAYDTVVLERLRKAGLVSQAAQERSNGGTAQGTPEALPELDGSGSRKGERPARAATGETQKRHK